MVRTFPSAPPRRRLQVVIALVVALALAAVTASVVPAAADDLRHREKKVGKKIKAAAHDVHVSSKQLARARGKLNAARTKLGKAQSVLNRTQARLTAARVHDAKMQRELTAANQRLARSRAELAEAKQDVERQRDRMGSLVARNYQQGNPELIGLAAMLQSGNPKEITSQVNTVHNLMNRQAGMLDELKAAEERARALERQVHEQRQVVASRKVAAEKVVAERVTLERRASADRAVVVKLVSKRRSAQYVANRVLAQDRRILRQLKREENKIRQMLRARARKAGKAGKSYRGRADGYLTRPVPGAVTSPYGYRKHPIYGYWGLHDGIDFSTPCGQNMIAAASGVVVSRYWSDVYGNRLVIDLGRVNGKSLAVIYNHASGYRVGTGERVSRGEKVGDAGNTGWSTGCHLHFTVLVNGSPRNPANWL